MPNVLSILFDEEQGSFYAGAFAALSSKSDILGFLGGMDSPVIASFERGFTNGVKFVKPQATVLSHYIGSTPEAFDMPEKAFNLGMDMAKNGAQAEDKEMAAAQVKQAEGVVAEVTSYVNETILTAYADGEVTEIYPHVGELVGTGAPIMSVAIMNDIWATFNVREDYLKQMQIGTEFNAYIPALDTTVIMKINYMKDLGDYAAWKATKQTGQYDLKTFEVRAVAKKPVTNLRAGMTVLYKINEK